MNIIICGSRDIEDETLEDIDHLVGLLKSIVKLQNRDVSCVLCGEARGIDQLGKRWAKENQIDVKSFPADWNSYGKAAGPIRNGEMVKEADGVVAILYPDSRGTKNCIAQAVDKGLPVVAKVINQDFKEIHIIVDKEDYSNFVKNQ